VPQAGEQGFSTCGAFKTQTIAFSFQEVEPT
jgi:hypothetical protein